MPPRKLLLGFLALWIAVGVLLLVASVDTVREGWFGAAHANPHLVLLGGVEAIAALLFLIPRSMRIGAVGLLATIAVAVTVHIVLGQFRGDLLIDAAAVLFIAIHGPLTSAQLRAAVT